MYLEIKRSSYILWLYFMAKKKQSLKKFYGKYQIMKITSLLSLLFPKLMFYINIFLSATIPGGYLERSMHDECTQQLLTACLADIKAKLRCRFSAISRPIRLQGSNFIAHCRN